MSDLPTPNPNFAEVVAMIAAARQRAYQSVNTALIDLYWQVGEYISHKIASAEWGDAVIPQLAKHIATTQPGLRGFTRPNLFRMRQFYETYRDSPIISALLRQLPWTHNLIVLSQSKCLEEREFYLRMAVKEHWSSRELERQFKSALFERTVLSPPIVSPPLRQLHPEALAVFKDVYLLEFLDLPQDHAEADLHRSLLLKLKDFLIELGRDFCFVGSEFPMQVGGRDFALDLLFFTAALIAWSPSSLRSASSSRNISANSASISKRSIAMSKSPRATRHRCPAVCQQRCRGRRIRPEPHALASIDRRIPDSVAGQKTSGS